MAVRGKLPPHLRKAAVDETELARFLASQDLRKADRAEEEKLKCPACGNEIDVPEDYDEDEIACPVCGEMVAVKAAGKDAA